MRFEPQISTKPSGVHILTNAFSTRARIQCTDWDTIAILEIRIAERIRCGISSQWLEQQRSGEPLMILDVDVDAMHLLAFLPTDRGASYRRPHGGVAPVECHLCGGHIFDFVSHARNKQNVVCDHVYHTWCAAHLKTRCKSTTEMDLNAPCLTCHLQFDT
jgi:hypothetical protein